MPFEPRISIITLGVSDMTTSIQFYRDGLGFPTSAEDEATWAFFETNGTRFSLYPYDLLVKDVLPGMEKTRGGFGGITLAHNARTREEVDEVLEIAKSAGGNIITPAQKTGWGGYSGYFSDPDEHLWEVAWGPMFEITDEGTLILKK